jgi:hypothetical protein
VTELPDEIRQDGSDYDRRYKLRAADGMERYEWIICRPNANFSLRNFARHRQSVYTGRLANSREG